VLLTTSHAYFSGVDSTTINDLVETRAKVTVSDGEISDVLTLKKDDSYFPPFVYQGTKLKGEVGKTYTLTVELKGEKYTATTTIPPPALLEELWYQGVPEREGRGYIYGRFTDDPDVDNYYRIFTMRLGKDEDFLFRCICLLWGISTLTARALRSLFSEVRSRLRMSSTTSSLKKVIRCG